MKVFFSRRAAAAAATPPAYSLSLALHTDAGPVREHNEDCIAALNAWVGEPREERTVLVALADGMGGHQAGEMASRLAVQAALHSFGRSLEGNDTAARLRQALAAANAAVFEQAQQGAQWQGMGTTLVLFAPAADGAHVAWVGDSRLYHWRDGVLRCLTRDDTLVMGLLERGLIAADELARHPDHSVLTQAVGTRTAIASPHVAGPLPLALGDRFLLCSDGVHDVVSDAKLALLLALPTPHAALQAITEAALRNGANDNLSVGVVHVAPPAAPRTARDTRSEAEVQP